MAKWTERSKKDCNVKSIYWWKIRNWWHHPSMVKSMMRPHISYWMFEASFRAYFLPLTFKDKTLITCHKHYAIEILFFLKYWLKYGPSWLRYWTPFSCKGDMGRIKYFKYAKWYANFGINVCEYLENKARTQEELQYKIKQKQIPRQYIRLNPYILHNFTNNAFLCHPTPLKSYINRYSLSSFLKTNRKVNPK